MGRRPRPRAILDPDQAAALHLLQPGFGVEQGPEHPRHAPGVGIGLTLVARFAELHGGRAWVEDRPGGGSSFRVLLPDPPVPAAVSAVPAKRS